MLSAVLDMLRILPLLAAPGTADKERTVLSLVLLPIQKIWREAVDAGEGGIPGRDVLHYWFSFHLFLSFLPSSFPGHEAFGHMGCICFPEPAGTSVVVWAAHISVRRGTFAELP